MIQTKSWLCCFLLIIECGLVLLNFGCGEDQVKSEKKEIIVSEKSIIIDAVKNAVMGLDTSMSISDALTGNEYIDRIEWDLFITKQNQSIVEAILHVDGSKILKNIEDGEIDDIYDNGRDRSNYTTEYERSDKKKQVLDNYHSRFKSVLIKLQFKLSKDKENFQMLPDEFKLNFSPEYSKFEKWENSINFENKNPILERLYANICPLSAMDLTRTDVFFK